MVLRGKHKTFGFITPNGNCEFGNKYRATYCNVFAVTNFFDK